MEKMLSQCSREEQAMFDLFINNIINKTFKVLPIWEDCEAQNKNFVNFNSYLDKLTTLLAGSNYIYKEEKLYEIMMMLQGLGKRENLSQQKVKSIVFHCIDTLKKINTEE